MMNTYTFESTASIEVSIDAYNIDDAVYRLRKHYPKSKFKINTITYNGIKFSSVKEIRKLEE